MRTFTSGIVAYKIPNISEPLPLEIATDDNRTVIFCPYLNEYGDGEDFESALSELSSSLIDLRKSLTKHQRRLGRDDTIILDRLNKLLGVD